MKGFRMQPEATDKFMKSCQSMLNDFSKTASIFEYAQFKKKMKEWMASNKPLNSKNLSGYHSFIIENTKV